RRCRDSTTRSPPLRRPADVRGSARAHSDRCAPLSRSRPVVSAEPLNHGSAHNENALRLQMREIRVSALVLVIEDEPGIVNFLERGLAAHGFDIVSAADGDSGIDTALHADVDLVVLDMMLPGRGGLEVLERLRRAKPTLPVIVPTALDQVEHRDRKSTR